LRQVKFLEGGEVRGQGVAVAEVANDDAGIQQTLLPRVTIDPIRFRPDGALKVLAIFPSHATRRG